MRIQSFFVREISAPLVTPFRIATGQHNTLHNVFFCIELASGVQGFGEAAVATHITGETIEATIRNLKEVGAALLGEDVSDYRALLGSLKERLTGNHAALAAVEMAVLDALTRALKIPLWRLFGEKPVPLTSDITIVIGSLEEAAAAAKAYSRQGFKAFKIKVGKDRGLDLQRVCAVRKAAPKADIILDANQGFDAEGMLKFLKTLKAQGIRPVLLEQPVPKADWEGLQKVTRLAGTLVCADESVGSLHDAVRAVKERSVSAI
ncbi:MAG: dipeptide epimerase, partial [Candidatus Omnitrophica bacterium]|nr:dipeptide epimerase [Candidatus Omnitrophota bacterium]